MSDKSVRDRIRSLRAEIKRHNENYYQRNLQEISDEEYDLLFKELSELEARHAELASESSPTQGVEVGARRKGRQIRHLSRMGSIETVTPQDSVESELSPFNWTIARQFVSACTAAAQNLPLRFNCELKLDGVAISLQYEHRRLQSAATRGDGETGEDVTENALGVIGIPEFIPECPFEGRFEVRGEVIFHREDFNAIREAQLQREEEPFVNARNAASGCIRQEGFRITGERQLHFYTYGLGLDLAFAPTSSQNETLKWLSDRGFSVAPNSSLALTVDEIASYYEKIYRIRGELPFDIDGVVVKVDDLELRDRLGTTNHHPRWAQAYKFPAEQAVTRVRAIDIQVGRTGVLTPVAVLDPVFVGGVNVTNATLHNEGEVHRKDVREGDLVIVRRAGDVIPEVFRSLSAFTQRSAMSFAMPKECPVCGSLVVRESKAQRLKTKVRTIEGAAYRCIGGLYCPAQRKGAIAHFASKGALDIVGLGEKLIDQLVDAQIVRSPSDLYHLSLERLVSLDRIGRLSGQALLLEIEASKSKPLSRFIFALGIPGIGEVLARTLATHLGSLNRLRVAFPTTLQFIPDIGVEAAENIYKFFNDPHNLAEIDNLLSSGFSFEEQQVSSHLRNAPTLSGFLELLRINKIGPGSAKKLESKFGSMKGLFEASSTTLVEVIGAAAANELCNYMSLSGRRNEIDRWERQLAEFGIHWEGRIQDSSALEQSKLAFSDCVIVVTGRFNRISRKEVEDLILRNGGKLSGSISRRTSFLVCGDEPGSKLQTATELGVKVILEDAFIDLVSGRSQLSLPF